MCQGNDESQGEAQHKQIEYTSQPEEIYPPAQRKIQNTKYRQNSRIPTSSSQAKVPDKRGHSYHIWHMHEATVTWDMTTPLSELA